MSEQVWTSSRDEYIPDASGDCPRESTDGWCPDLLTGGRGSNKSPESKGGWGDTSGDTWGTKEEPNEKASGWGATNSWGSGNDANNQKTDVAAVGWGGSGDGWGSGQRSSGKTEEEWGAGGRDSAPYGSDSGRPEGRDRRGDRDEQRGTGMSDFTFELKIPEWQQELKELPPFQKDFYIPHPDIEARDIAEDIKYLEENNVKMLNGEEVRPITSFEQATFPDFINRAVRKAGFPRPTPIQSVGWPSALSGRDLVGIAETGSGKTLAFALPAVVHINAQEPLRKGDGPIVLVLAPTRELAIQIRQEFAKFGESAEVRATCLYGGADKNSQIHDLNVGVHVVVATPGRLLDLINRGITNLKRVTYFVVDEADKMLEMGFEHQLRNISGQIRPDRQTLMWTATWPKRVYTLANDFLKNPIKIKVGRRNLTSNANIDQRLVFTPQMVDKVKTLLALLAAPSPEESTDKSDTSMSTGGVTSFLDLHVSATDKLLVFCNTKKACDNLTRMLRRNGFGANAIHGDKTQADREYILSLFSADTTMAGESNNILVATDLAARGLDIPGVTFIINFDFPLNRAEAKPYQRENSVPPCLVEYTHRIGRTGRAFHKGTAITFIAPYEQIYIEPLISMIERTKEMSDEERSKVMRGQQEDNAIVSSRVKKYDIRLQYDEDEPYSGGGGRAPRRRGGFEDSRRGRDDDRGSTGRVGYGGGSRRDNPWGGDRGSEDRYPRRDGGARGDDRDNWGTSSGANRQDEDPWADSGRGRGRGSFGRDGDSRRSDTRGGDRGNDSDDFRSKRLPPSSFGGGGDGWGASSGRGAQRDSGSDDWGSNSRGGAGGSRARSQDNEGGWGARDNRDQARGGSRRDEGRGGGWGGDGDNGGDGERGSENNRDRRGGSWGDSGSSPRSSAGGDRGRDTWGGEPAASASKDSWGGDSKGGGGWESDDKSSMPSGDSWGGAAKASGWGGDEGGSGGWGADESKQSPPPTPSKPPASHRDDTGERADSGSWDSWGSSPKTSGTGQPFAAGSSW